MCELVDRYARAVWSPRKRGMGRIVRRGLEDFGHFVRRENIWEIIPGGVRKGAEAGGVDDVRPGWAITDSVPTRSDDQRGRSYGLVPT